MTTLTPFPTPGYWVHHLDPFVFHFPEGWFLDGIRWYGLAYLLGLLFGYFMLGFYYKKGRSPLDDNARSNFLIALLLGVLLGGRLGYMLLYHFDVLCEKPLEFFAVWNGGMASHGGMIGVALACWWTARRYKASFLQLTDCIVSLAGFGVFLGRIANFINGELWGKVTDVPWAVVFPWREFIDGKEQIVGYLLPRHPSQLYAATLEGLAILIYTQIRFWKKQSLPHGQLLGETAVLYGVFRVFNEFFREPDIGVSLICGLSRGTVYSLLLIAVGIGVIVFVRRRSRRSRQTPAA
ncbi:MAG: prolipoprotein diacylglyceryl transferase [Opitutales bacterium]|nr:prolipoprotein diacylglyceryl transferase [Opitutales bacterium]